MFLYRYNICTYPSFLSQTRKLITQINQVCEMICDMKLHSPNKKNHGLPSNYRRNKGHPPSKCEKDGKGYTRSGGNKKHAHCEDLQSSPHIQRHHALPSLPLLLPRVPPSLMSSHASSEVCKVGASTSYSEQPSCSTVSTSAPTMALNSSQKETKESSDEQDSRAGGLACPDKTEVWRSRKEAGIGDCWKSPTMAH